MTRLSVGDMAVLARWFEDCRPKLLAMLRRRIDPALAVRLDPEDVLHDAYLEAQRRWPKFAAGTMTPYAWLYRIALDCLWEAWDRETRGRRDLRKELPWPEHSSIELGLNLAAALSTPSEAFARGEVRAGPQTDGPARR